jgi:sec-independent protein translocase protein TatB
MLSIPHLIIIFVVALIVFGPEKLPELARNLGKVMAEFRRATGDLRSTFEDHLRDLEREAEERRIGGSAREAPRATALLEGRETQASVPPPATVPAGAAPTLRPRPDLPLKASERSEESRPGEAANGATAGSSLSSISSVEGAAVDAAHRSSAEEPEDHSEIVTDGHTPA